MMIELMAELLRFHGKTQVAEAAKVLESLDFEVILIPSLILQCTYAHNHHIQAFIG